MRRTRLTLSDWAVLVRFDDGSVAEMLCPAPAELCARGEGSRAAGKLRVRLSGLAPVRRTDDAA
jgi:hypothetical protein